MIIRSETPADYAAITRLNVRAFGVRADEAVVVSLLRQRASFTPELSLVAEMDGAIVGHALFTPGEMPLMGQRVKAALLAPLAVDPSVQRQGIGGALLRAGHEAARQHGAVIALLLGHPEYYPRFGYRTQAFGMARCKVDVTALPPAEPVTTRKVAESDVPALMTLWDHEEGAVDFSVRPDAELIDWLSPNAQIGATVYERKGVVMGYTRIHQAAPAEPRLFLAGDADAARAIAHAVATAGGGHTLTLPLHPTSASGQVFGGAAVNTFDPAMAAELVSGALDAYLADVQAGARERGRPLWCPAFDLV